MVTGFPFSTALISSGSLFLASVTLTCTRTITAIFDSYFKKIFRCGEGSLNAQVPIKRATKTVNQQGTQGSTGDPMGLINVLRLPFKATLTGIDWVLDFENSRSNASVFEWKVAHQSSFISCARQTHTFDWLEAHFL